MIDNQKALFVLTIILTIFAVALAVIWLYYMEQARGERQKRLTHENQYQSHLRHNPIFGHVQGIVTHDGGYRWFAWRTAEDGTKLLDPVPDSVLKQLETFDTQMMTLLNDLTHRKRPECTPDHIFGWVEAYLRTAGFKVEFVPVMETDAETSDVPTAQTQAITAQPENNESSHGAQQFGLSPAT